MPCRFTAAKPGRSAANVAGNDVFENSLVDQQESLFEAAVERFHDALAAFETALGFKQGHGVEHSAELRRPIAETRQAMATMQTQAAEIFLLLREGDTNAAGSYMAAFDRSNARLHGALSSIRSHISMIIINHFDEQQASAALMAKLVIGVVGMITLMVVAVGIYSLRLAKTMKLLSEDRAKAARALTDQQRAMDEHSIVSATDTNGDIIYVNGKFCEISVIMPTVRCHRSEAISR